MMTQREMEKAYLEGRDIAAIWRRRQLAAVALGVAVRAPVGLLLLYAVKSALGIDLFPGVHAWELMLGF